MGDCQRSFAVPVCPGGSSLSDSALDTTWCPKKMQAQNDHCPDLRFDVEGEEDTSDDLKLYGFLMQSAIDLYGGQTQNSDGMD
jgi:hypothetical protein